MKPMELIVMRLADMRRVHPKQISAHCYGCNHEVAVFPSGQIAMRQYPGIRLMCQVCRQPGDNAQFAPGAAFEPFQTNHK